MTSKSFRGVSMMRSDPVFVVAVVAFVLAMAVNIWLWVAFLPGVPLLAFLLEMSVVLKLVAFMVVSLIMVGLIGGLMGEVALCRVVAGLAVALALVGAAYGEMNVQIVVRQIGPVDFAIAALSRAESFGLIALGLFVAVLSLGLSHLRRPRKV